MPYSVTIVSASDRGIVTTVPGSCIGTTRETAPPSAVDFITVIARPPFEYIAA